MHVIEVEGFTPVVQEDLGPYVAERRATEWHDAPFVLEVLAAVLQQLLAVVARVELFVLGQRIRLQLVPDASSPAFSSSR